jgi:hypothetical protein
MEPEEIREALSALRTAPLDRIRGTVTVYWDTVEACGIDYDEAVAWAVANGGAPKEDEIECTVRLEPGGIEVSDRLDPMCWLEVPLAALEAPQ